jgi:glycosyltransferase involved in cell wall biosynthesis
MLEALAACGLRCTVFQPFWTDESFELDGVGYHFVAEPRFGWRIGYRLCRFRGLHRLFGAVAAHRPEVIHVHGMVFPVQTARLGRRLPDVPIVVQDHGSRVPVGARRLLYRWGFTRIDAVAFTAREQAQPFLAARVLPTGIPVFEVLESSSRFTPGDLSAARTATGLYGDPCLLWVGRLDANKDPLMVLEAFRRAIPQLPDPHLWCCYTEAPLLPWVQQRLARDDDLRRRVHLLGAVSHKRVELLSRAADFFLSGSHAEGSGYAVLEALACGTTPLVTDIPSFRRITGQGKAGALSPPGDSVAMARAIIDWSRRDRARLRETARTHFEQALSFGVVAAELRAAYEPLAARP